MENGIITESYFIGADNLLYRAVDNGKEVVFCKCNAATSKNETERDND